jgi:alpha-beta hydrolase superfamily lysophospholipase
LATDQIPTWITHFPGNFMWSNATLVTKGMAPYAAVALGEIDEIAERLRSRQHEPSAGWEEWSAMAERVEAVGVAAEAEERHLTAGHYFLRAGMYYFTAERFIPPGSEKRQMGEKAIECCTAGILRRHPNVERVEVPYESGSLPALFMSAGAGPAPTIVLFDGLDNCKEMSVLFAGLEFAARGWNTLSIDGPGQGESLRLRGITTRPDYEVAGTAAFEYVATRPDVDEARVAVMGYSFGGYYAPRIAAFEDRYVACVAFGAMHWDLASWVREIRDSVAADPKTSAASHFQVPWVFGVPGLDEAIEMASEFNLGDVAGRVRCPFLVAHGENDRQVPIEDARKLLEAIGSEDKSLIAFTAEGGGAEHVQVDNRQVGVDAIADWLEPRLR